MMHHPTASSVPHQKIPRSIAVTFKIEENKPQMNKLLVSLAAWKIEPDDDSIIWIPTESDKIWNTGTDGIH